MKSGSCVKCYLYFICIWRLVIIHCNEMNKNVVNNCPELSFCGLQSSILREWKNSIKHVLWYKETVLNENYFSRQDRETSQSNLNTSNTKWKIHFCKNNAKQSWQVWSTGLVTDVWAPNLYVCFHFFLYTYRSSWAWDISWLGMHTEYF